MKNALRVLSIVGLAAASTAALAGRPLSVDDAGTNAKGEGHVEVWAARAGGATSLNLSPAYAFADGVEIAALLARDSTNDITGSAVQLKWLFTPSKDKGCNVGASVGTARTRGSRASANAGFITGLLSCSSTALGNLHLNLGRLKTSGQSAVGTWGVAIEREYGAVTPHIEWFGAEGSKPPWQVGARGDIVKGIQLDGSVGRGEGMTLYSVGMKFMF